MTQLTIEIKDSKTLKLIEDLADLKLIRVLKAKAKEGERKLSDRLAGTLTLSQAKELDRELKKMRKEWERGT
jgi:hypothetical protein